MSDFTLSDGTDTVTFRLEYDHMVKSTLSVLKSRTTTGEGYFLDYGSWLNFKLPVRYVSQADKDIINNWSANKTTLTLTLEGEVYSTRITNKRSPISQLIPPYSYVFRGNLEMELV